MDGYSIWQFKAKSFVLFGDLHILRDPQLAYSHVDYPLLIPIQTWWACRHFGAYNERLAQGTCALFYIDLLALFIASARRYLSLERTLMGAGILAMLPVLTAHAMNGFADLALAVYLLAIGSFLARALIEGDRGVVPVLAWLFAGIVLVKNEGLMACSAGIITMTLFHRSRHNSQASPNALRATNHGLSLWLLSCIMAIAVSYLPWFLQKRAWHLHNDIMEASTRPVMTPGLLRWRLSYALLGFFREKTAIAHIGPWFPAWGLLVFLFPIGLWSGLRRRVRLCNPLWILCALQLCGYIGVYLITPWSLPDHMKASVDRLTLHLVPTLLLASLLGCFAETRNRQEQS